MTASVRSLRKRLLQVFSRAELVGIVTPYYADAYKRGKDPLIEYMLNNWHVEYDEAIHTVVDKAIPRKML